MDCSIRCSPGSWSTLQPRDLEHIAAIFYAALSYTEGSGHNVKTDGGASMHQCSNSLLLQGVHQPFHGRLQPPLILRLWLFKLTLTSIRAITIAAHTTLWRLLESGAFRA